MKQVSQEEFFRAIGHKDVHPSIAQSKWDRNHGFAAIWKTRSGQVVGQSVGGTTLQPARYYLPK